MLQEFSIGNFWSFKDIQTLHLQAAPIRSKFKHVDEQNTFVINDQLSLLKSKAIFGANASGKSNLVRAFVGMLIIIKDCLKDNQILEKRINPFLFQKENLRQPSFFQIVFMVDGIQYRYGFEATKKTIVSEWLFGKPVIPEKGFPKARERYYFTREGMEVKINEERFKEGERFAKITQDTPPLYRENTLFLSVIAAFNGAISKLITDTFQHQFRVISGIEEPERWVYVLRAMSEWPGYTEKLTQLLRAVDQSIESIQLVEAPSEQISKVEMITDPRDSKVEKAAFIVVNRNLRDEQGEIVQKIPLDLYNQEAEGTKKIATLSPVLFDVLDQGGVLWIDEFDARMHPKLTRKIIELFHQPSTNPHTAQLVFVTHDSNLLDAKLLRRDQITFAKKDRSGATELFSLVEFKGVRNDRSFEKDYLLGKYGAVPNNLNVLEEAVEKYITHAEKE